MTGFVDDDVNRLLGLNTRREVVTNTELGQHLGTANGSLWILDQPPRAFGLPPCPKRGRSRERNAAESIELRPPQPYDGSSA